MVTLVFGRTYFCLLRAHEQIKTGNSSTFEEKFHEDPVTHDEHLIMKMSHAGANMKQRLA